VGDVGVTEVAVGVYVPVCVEPGVVFAEVGVAEVPDDAALPAAASAARVDATGTSPEHATSSATPADVPAIFKKSLRSLASLIKFALSTCGGESLTAP